MMISAPTDVAAADELADAVDQYAAYIRQVTNDGEAIVDCLIRIMEDDSVGAKPYERLDAQLLLDSIGFGRLAVDQASNVPANGDAPATPPTPASPAPPRAANDMRPRRPVLLLSEETLYRLPSLVRQKTDGGRKMADFLTAVVRGEHSDFKPHHWIRAAKHLAARAYSREIGPERPGLSVKDAMKLIDRLFPGFKHYHRVNLRHIIRRGYEDAEADDDRPNLEAARPEPVAEAEPEPEPVYRPKFEALRAHYEAMVKAQEEQRRREDEEYERLEKERRKQDERPDPAERCSEETETEVIPDPPDDYESRRGRRIGLSRWERKAMMKGHNLGWDCGIPP